MAAGTGLPTNRGDVATTQTDMRGFGAGEMAAAEALAQGAGALDKIVRTMEPALQQAATVQAEQKVAAGQFDERMVITGADDAYNRAMSAGTKARLATQRDADLDALQIEHAFNPDGFQKAVQEYRSSALQGAVPAALAMEWGADFDQRANRSLSTIRSARAQSDLTEAKGNIESRIDRLSAETVDLAQGRSLVEAWEDPQVQANLLLMTRDYDELAENPAFGLGEEEAAAKREATVARMKAGIASGSAVAVLRQQGPDAALAAIQQMMTTPDMFASPLERDLAVATAREAVNGEINLTNQRRNIADAERAATEQQLRRDMAEDWAKYALDGQGTGLTEDQVRAKGGERAVLEWYQGRAKAHSDRELYRDLPNDPDEAAAEIVRRAALPGFDALPMIADSGDLATVAAAIEQVETGGRNGLVSADPDGGGPAGGGAFGIRQLLPETARRVAGELGLPFDQNRLRTDAAYNRRISDRHIQNLIDRYNGDTFLAITAYHAGEGNVDGWLRSVGDPRSGTITREAWLNGVEARGNPRSAAYPRKVLAAMNAGRASAAYDAYSGQRAAVRADPGRSVLQQPDVKNALSTWDAADPDSGEGLVRAILNAQERTGVRDGDRRSLPNAMLVPYAGALRQAESDPEAYRAITERLVEQFGDYGGRVLQDVLVLRGNTEYASQVAAAATRAARAGTRPPSPTQVQTARRVETMARASTGTADRNVRELSDDEIKAAAGL